MNLKFYRKLPIPKDIKAEFPLSEAAAECRRERTEAIKSILSNKDPRLLLVIGPCSADNEDTVLEYVSRLRRVEDKVKDKLLIVPRIYTNKPRTTCDGYLGMLHQPDPDGATDLLRGIIAIRRIHLRALTELGFGTADELLYPENHRYLSDLLVYTAVGARSVEDQHHRLVASGLDIPVGMKNPTSGDLSVMMNSIVAAQAPHTFLYRGWEVSSEGNPYAHAILRGSVDPEGGVHPNYGYESLIKTAELYAASGAKNPAVIVDTNHANSAKDYLKQPTIVKQVMRERRDHPEISRLVRGFMVESYISDGAGEPQIPGRSITDPCLGWEKTERLIYDIAEDL